MRPAEAAARRAVVEAGRRLLARGLVERTWGNVSARVSENYFVITPSGRGYDTLRPEDLVLVDLRDKSALGSGKPSSEKGIHADAYRLRPQVGFVIHTHQEMASIRSVQGRGFETDHPLLGGFVPCAAYGLPSTDTLRRAVKEQAAAHPESPAFLLKSHGALCLGRDMDQAFAVAEALEEVCGAQVAAALPPAAAPAVQELGESTRTGATFTLERRGQVSTYHPGDPRLRGAAALHGAIYRLTGAGAVVHCRAADVVTVSRAARTLRPMLDDLAQIAGAEILAVEPSARRAAAALLTGNAVLLRGLGAVCTGKTLEEARTVAMLLEKGAKAWRYGAVTPGCSALDRRDAWLMRFIYVTRYAKRKDARP